MTSYRKKLIEVALPLDSINKESAREKSIRHGHPSTLHLWWARRPLAACRAVLFSQLVDDPSSWPELFPTDEDQDRERQRLFALIEELVKWENSNSERVIGAARREIARSLARNRKAEGEADERDEAVLVDEPAREAVNRYLAEVAPPVLDPFAGGGSIPLEAQRLGLRAIASDLNPVAVLINKALIEIPPKFADRPPVNPESRKKMKAWRGAEGLAEDVRYYGEWMRKEAWKRIGHLYPHVKLPKEYGGGAATVIAWLWARTVPCPNPACGAAMPLVRSFELSRKKGRRAWAEPQVKGSEYFFEIRSGSGEAPEGTVGRRGARCICCGSPTGFEYLRLQGRAKRIGARLLAIVAYANGQRIYLPPDAEHTATAELACPDWVPDTSLPQRALGFRVPGYGLGRHADLFTPRQLVTLTTHMELVGAALKKILTDVVASGMPHRTNGVKLPDDEKSAYTKAVATYAAISVSKLTDYNSCLVQWSPNRDQAKTTFTRQALPMVWDFAEVNPFSGAAGDLRVSLAGPERFLKSVAQGLAQGETHQTDAAAAQSGAGLVVATDPPYYDNIGYADLSDFFYVWLRYALRDIYPGLFGTMLVPKKEELVAAPHRFNDNVDQARSFFEQGLENAFREMLDVQPHDFPMTFYYAFKQAEVDSQDRAVASTGWETMLEGLSRAGWSTTATWPIRTERGGRTRDIGSSALASSIVLACRKRPSDASIITRSEFRRLLRSELPEPLLHLQHGNIAPVDLAQASIGPGIAIFSRHSKVIEADGSAMTVRTALQLINHALDEYLAEREGEVDADTRFAVTWFETHGFEVGPFGEAETLAKARNVSVQGVVGAGVLHSVAGKTRLLRRGELPNDWDPTKDERLTVWEVTQQLIKRLDEQGEEAAAELLSKLGSAAEQAHDLAYRLYTTCERRGWAEEARAYNGLIIVWPELEKLAAQRKAQPERVQRELF